MFIVLIRLAQFLTFSPLYNNITQEKWIPTVPLTVEKVLFWKAVFIRFFLKVCVHRRNSIKPTFPSDAMRQKSQWQKNKTGRKVWICFIQMLSDLSILWFFFFSLCDQSFKCQCSHSIKNFSALHDPQQAIACMALTLSYPISFNQSPKSTSLSHLLFVPQCLLLLLLSQIK